MILHALLIAPFAAALLLCFSSDRDETATGRLAFALSLVVWALSLALFPLGSAATAPLPWFHLWGTSSVVNYQLGTDALSTWLIQIATFLTPVAILGSRGRLDGRMREFAIAMLAMEGAIVGAFLARDLVLFYLFFEAMLIPVVVLIGLFGGRERRPAALTFFLYTMLGSVPMLVGIWYLASIAGSTDLSVLVRATQSIEPQTQLLLFAAFALAFAVKVPLVPLHSWQAPAYAESPAGAAALVAGAMAKVGAYGFLRLVIPLFPGPSLTWAPVFIALGLIGMVVGALIAFSQRDLKRLLAFSSLSHLGLVVAGIFTFKEIALSGAVALMVAHGLSVAALFLLVGFLEARSPTRHIDDFGGLARLAPVFSALFAIAMLGAVALPGTAGFAGEFLLLMGIWQYSGENYAWQVVAIAGTSVILGAAYMLHMTQKLLFGPQALPPVTNGAATNGNPGVPRISGDLTAREVLAVAPLLVATIALGLFPAPLTRQAGQAAYASITGTALTAPQSLESPNAAAGR